MFQLRPAGVSPDIPPAADHVLSQPRFPHQHELGTLRRPGSSAAKTRRRQDRMTRPHGADPAVRAGAVRGSPQRSARHGRRYGLRRQAGVEVPMPGAVFSSVIHPMIGRTLRQPSRRGARPTADSARSSPPHDLLRPRPQEEPSTPVIPAGGRVPHRPGHARRGRPARSRRPCRSSLRRAPCPRAHNPINLHLVTSDIQNVIILEKTTNERQTYFRGAVETRRHAARPTPEDVRPRPGGNVIRISASSHNRLRHSSISPFG
ncbi:hypothetical protein Franean1_0214 [Parafrankia sp. EAN1pec]|nr:hypothetical protein Franean1_0214 [Frankia sp. EAN1pec]